MEGIRLRSPWPSLATGLAFQLGRFAQMAQARSNSTDNRVRWEWLAHQAREALSQALITGPKNHSYGSLLWATSPMDKPVAILRALHRHLSDERYPADNVEEVARSLALIAEMEGMALFVVTRNWGGDGVFENLCALCMEVRMEDGQPSEASMRRAETGLAQQLAFQMFRFSELMSRMARPLRALVNARVR